MRNRVSVLVLLMLMALGQTPAKAEVGTPTPTVQAVAADATWLAYTPPPEHPGIVCMVDSGVDPNPDTEAAVIGGQALAPETETNDEIARLDPRAQPGNHPNGHGTLMAMMMAAPINGWGMVGIAPTSVRVYNMKALPKGQTTFPAKEFYGAIERCQEVQESASPSMVVVNLSLGGEASPEAAVATRFQRVVASANKDGLSVVAAAGNTGGSILFPASYAPVMSVAAGDAGSGPGALCPFASHGEGLDLIAPGCDNQIGGLEGTFEDDGSPAVGSGSSQASAIVSAVLASIRAYAPQLTYTKAEECLTTTAKSGLIDAAAAFDACGLSQVVSDGQAAEQDATNGSQQGTSSGSQSSGTLTISQNNCATGGSCQGSPSSSVLPSEAARLSGFESETRCPRPQIANVTRRGGDIVLRADGRPSGCRLQARLRVRHGRNIRWVLSRSVLSDRLLVSSQNWSGLQVRYASGSSDRTSSQWIAVETRKVRT